MPGAPTRHVIVRRVGARHMLAVFARGDRKNVDGALSTTRNDRGLTTAPACRLDRPGCEEQRQHQSGNGEQAVHKTQGQDFRTISHERSNRARQVLKTC